MRGICEGDGALGGSEGSPRRSWYRGEEKGGTSSNSTVEAVDLAGEEGSSRAIGEYALSYEGLKGTEDAGEGESESSPGRTGEYDGSRRGEDSGVSGNTR